MNKPTQTPRNLDKDATNATNRHGFTERLQFLKPVMKAGKSRDSLDQQSSSPDIEVDSVNDNLNEDNEENISPLQKVHRKGFKRKQDLAAKKHQVLETCLQVLKEPVQRDGEKSLVTLQCTLLRSWKHLINRKG